MLLTPWLRLRKRVAMCFSDSCLGLDAVRPGEGAVAAYRIAPARYFYLDDLRAQPGQGHAQERAGQKYGNGQNAQIGKGLHLNLLLYHGVSRR